MTPEPISDRAKYEADLAVLYGETGTLRWFRACQNLAVDVAPLLDERDAAQAEVVRLRASLTAELAEHKKVRVSHIGGSDEICSLCQHEPFSQYDPVWPCEGFKRISAALAAGSGVTP